MPRLDTTVKTTQQTRVTYAVGVVMYVAGVSAVLVGLVAVGAMLPPFPLDAPDDLAAPPAPVVTTANSVALTWTAPGDDGASGQAAQYDVRYATAPISEATFGSATPVTNPPLPRPAGQAEQLTVTGLTAGTTYYFALKTADEAQNWSAISNVATATTAAAACTPEWSCTDWSACVDGTQSRTCVDGAGCDTAVGRPIESRTCTAPPTTGACTPEWSCTDWSACVDGTQSRTCVDGNGCGADTDRPEEQAPCGAGGPGPSEDLLAVVPRKRARARVRVYDRTLSLTAQFLASRRRNGGNVAVGDTDGDGEPEVVVGTGYGAAPVFRVFDPSGRREASVRPWSKRHRFGLRVFAGDLDGDGVDEIVVNPVRRTSSTVRVYRYDVARHRYRRSASQRLFSSRYREGINGSFADLDNDGVDEFVVVRARKVRSTVFVYEYDVRARRFRRRTVFRAFGARDRRGLHVATGDVDNDGVVEIVVAREKGTRPIVRVFSPEGRREYQFAAASSRFRGGVTVATFDTDLDGQDEIATAVASAGAPGIFLFKLQADRRTFVRVATVRAFDPGVRFGIRIASP